MTQPNCPSCGAQQHTTAASFCADCGAALPSDAPLGTVRATHATPVSGEPKGRSSMVPIIAVAAVCVLLFAAILSIALLNDDEPKQAAVAATASTPQQADAAPRGAVALSVTKVGQNGRVEAESVRLRGRTEKGAVVRVNGEPTIPGNAAGEHTWSRDVQVPTSPRVFTVTASIPGRKTATKTVTLARTKPKPKPAPAPVAAATPPPAARATPPREAGMTACDQNISAGAVSCGLAMNTFWEYWNSGQRTSLTVWDPAADTYRAMTCIDFNDAYVGCGLNDGTDDVTFPTSAVNGYSQAAANRYADSHETGPG